MKRCSSAARFGLAILCSLALSIATARAARAELVTYPGSFADTPGPRVLRSTVDGNVEVVAHAIHYRVPKHALVGASAAIDPRRLQGMRLRAGVLLDVRGSYTAPNGPDPLWWLVDAGFRAWWSLGAPAQGDEPSGLGVFGGQIESFAYGDTTPAGTSSNYTGIGLREVDAQLYVDPTNERLLRAIAGAGQFVDVYLNIRSHVDSQASSHWLHEVRITATPRALFEVPQWIQVSYDSANAGAPVWKRDVGPWRELELALSDRVEGMPGPTGGSSYVEWAPGSSHPWATGVLPPLGGDPERVSLETSDTSFMLQGVENLDLAPSTCGGSAVVCGFLTTEPFVGNTNLLGAGMGVGSGPQQPLSAFDDDVDWRGASGRYRVNAQPGPNPTTVMMIDSPVNIATMRDEGTTVSMRPWVRATFVPTEPDSRIAWTMQAGKKLLVRSVGWTRVD